jgi:hypothetical protein
MVLKINKFFLYNCLFLWKGQWHEIFYLQFFSHELIGFHGQKYAENCGSEALKFRTSTNFVIAELRCRSCGATFLQKVAELRLQKCFLQVAELGFGLRKKLCVPTSGN